MTEVKTYNAKAVVSSEENCLLSDSQLHKTQAFSFVSYIAFDASTTSDGKRETGRGDDRSHVRG